MTRIKGSKKYSRVTSSSAVAPTRAASTPVVTLVFPSKALSVPSSKASYKCHVQYSADYFEGPRKPRRCYSGRSNPWVALDGGVTVQRRHIRFVVVVIAFLHPHRAIPGMPVCRDVMFVGERKQCPVRFAVYLGLQRLFAFEQISHCARSFGAIWRSLTTARGSFLDEGYVGLCLDRIKLPEYTFYRFALIRAKVACLACYIAKINIFLFFFCVCVFYVVLGAKKKKKT